MRNLLITAATLALLAAPAVALECDTGQGQNIVLDFALGSGDKPLLDIAPRHVAESCVDGASIFSIKGMAGTYPSAEDAMNVFHLVQSLSRYKLTGEQYTAITKFVGEKEGQAVAAK